MGLSTRNSEITIKVIEYIAELVAARIAAEWFKKIEKKAFEIYQVRKLGHETFGNDLNFADMEENKTRAIEFLSLEEEQKK